VNLRDKIQHLFFAEEFRMLFSNPGRYVCMIAFLLAGIGARADVLVMKNGDRVTGTVVKKDGKSITLKTDSFGNVTAAWDQVASLESQAPLTVVLQGGKTVQGPLTAADGQVKVAANTGPVAAPVAEVVTIRDAAEEKAYERLLHPGWLELWAGTANLGLAGTEGNARTETLTVGMNAARTTNTDKTYVTFSAIDASALVNGVDSGTAKAVHAGIGYDHQLHSSRFFVNTFNNYEYDKYQNLDLRFTIGAGIGYSLVKTARRRLDLVGGGSYDRATYSPPLVQSTAAAYWGDDFNQKISTATTLTQTFRMFNDLNSGHAYRFAFDTGATTKIGKWITWNLALNDRYESDPAPGRKTNDWMYTTGFGVTFGGK
jgi:putative salt-induced outer membrane protein YdiY